MLTDSSAPGQKYGGDDFVQFYTDPSAIAAYKARIQHVMNHVNPHNGKRWADSPEYIFSFETQNEAMHDNVRPATSSVVTTDSQGRTTTSATVVPVTTVQPTVTNIPVKASNNGQERVTIITWPLWKVFVGNYLPVLSAIIFRLFWTSIYNKIKLIEPFTRLTNSQGAVAAETLHTYYLSSNLTPDPVILRIARSSLARCHCTRAATQSSPLWKHSQLLVSNPDSLSAAGFAVRAWQTSLKLERAGCVPGSRQRPPLSS